MSDKHPKIVSFHTAPAASGETGEPTRRSEIGELGVKGRKWYIVHKKGESSVTGYDTDGVHVVDQASADTAVRQLAAEADDLRRERDEARGEIERLRNWKAAYAKGRAGLVEQADADLARAEAAEAEAERLREGIREFQREVTDVNGEPIPEGLDRLDEAMLDLFSLLDTASREG